MTIVPEKMTTRTIMINLPEFEYNTKKSLASDLLVAYMRKAWLAGKTEVPMMEIYDVICTNVDVLKVLDTSVIGARRMMWNAARSLEKNGIIETFYKVGTNYMWLRFTTSYLKLAGLL